MNTQNTSIGRALLSVSDKTGIVEFARALRECDVEIVSTGGTAGILRDAGIEAVPVEHYTQTPEMMDGRVKTLHPAILGGILGLRDRHARDAAAHAIPWIDLVVCNLYPFERTVSDPSVGFDEAIEQIDIGGPSMVRAAAKNCGWVTVVTSIEDYDEVMRVLRETRSIPFNLRKSLAARAFAHTARYDAMIQSYLTEEPFPDEITLGFTRHTDTREQVEASDRLLRYGENPHQAAAVYRASLPAGKKDPFSILECPVVQGKRLSFNNLGDAYGAVETIREFKETACVVVKHATPCGVAVATNPLQALQRAFEADKSSAFGGIVVLNRQCDESMASYVSPVFIEVLLAPSYTPEALRILKKKKNLRVIETGVLPPVSKQLAGRFVGNDLLLQQRDDSVIEREHLRVVTKRVPDDREIDDLLFAWKVVKHVKSNAIVTAGELTTRGIGSGQVSRVDAVRIAMAKSGTAQRMVLASDAFFPFRDSIDTLKGSPVTAIIQPGGSIRDQEVIDACDESGISMVLTGVRCFLHG